MLGVFAFGSDYGWDTLKTLFTQRPGRVRVFAAKLAALGIALVPFVVALFAAGAVASAVIAQIEDAPMHWPSAWLLVRALAAGWLILATWAALGVLLGVLTRGTSLAIGVGILYALVIEGLLSAFADSVSVLEPLDQRVPARQRLLARRFARGVGRVDRLQRARLVQRPVRRVRAGARRAGRPRAGCSRRSPPRCCDAATSPDSLAGMEYRQLGTLRPAGSPRSRSAP